ncbi:hypothetical protein TRV_05187 [Trichophyton verrucosum HKI 0517]|uniref:Uncharacterized protein n=1 Tax=Trichophyton verrucosum (strain HKI 0517) TaxID=663202 RepID=D4DDH6_TRIVH|nr:uncharacterized protein TRV_05187 [Trichophyton verrucosum HKI 0517]EFE40118.1 hypothetical protein TRV_05187 [Trichophyton verrucosum HKI 0517]
MSPVKRSRWIFLHKGFLVKTENRGREKKRKKKKKEEKKKSLERKRLSAAMRWLEGYRRRPGL